MVRIPTQNNHLATITALSSIRIESHHILKKLYFSLTVSIGVDTSAVLVAIPSTILNIRHHEYQLTVNELGNAGLQ